MSALVVVSQLPPVTGSAESSVARSMSIAGPTGGLERGLQQEVTGLTTHEKYSVNSAEVMVKVTNTRKEGKNSPAKSTETDEPKRIGPKEGKNSSENSAGRYEPKATAAKKSKKSSAGSGGTAGKERKKATAKLKRIDKPKGTAKKPKKSSAGSAETNMSKGTAVTRAQGNELSSKAIYETSHYSVLDSG